MNVCQLKSFLCDVTGADLRLLLSLQTASIFSTMSVHSIHGSGNFVVEISSTVCADSTISISDTHDLFMKKAPCAEGDSGGRDCFIARREDRALRETRNNAL